MIRRWLTLSWPLNLCWPLPRGNGGALPPPASARERWGGLGWGVVRLFAVGAERTTPHPRPLPTAPRAGGGEHPRRWLRAALGVLLAVGFASAASAQTPPPAQPKVTVGYVDIEGDPRHEPIRAYERLVLKAREHPFVGAQVGIEEAQALTRVLKIDFALERIRVKSADAVAPAVLQARQERDIHFFVIDAPAEVFRPLAEAVRGRDVLLFNATAAEDTLRREVCAREVVHTLPSLAMSMDALVQYLVSRKWRDILVLHGPLPADAAMTKAFEASVKKFGNRIVAKKEFTTGTDTREREKNNPLLLTAINRDYDVVFVADDAFDFVRGVPFQTVRARPVIGSIELEPVAWHWTWERNGGPQINTRFARAANGRRMEGPDWAAWIAVKMVAQATLRTRSAEFDKQRAFILGDNSFDGYKGLAVSVRKWDQQLRQAVFLAAPYSVVASAPVEGFLHRTNTLDSLGD